MATLSITFFLEDISGYRTTDAVWGGVRWHSSLQLRLRLLAVVAAVVVPAMDTLLCDVERE